MEIRNAVIRSADLGPKDSPWMTSSLYLDYGAAYQSFGGFTLDDFDLWANKRVPGIWLSIWVTRVLEVAGVERWDDLVGQSIRVKADMGRVYAIGNILNEVWFNPEDEFAKVLESQVSGSSVLGEVAAERGRQDDKWGGPTHDDQHSLLDWYGYIRERCPSVILQSPKHERERLVQIAALAVAAIESHDRKSVNS